MTGTRKRFVRTAIVAAMALPFLLASPVPSFADHASQQDVANATANRDSINRQLEAIVEQYDAARYQLQQLQAQVAAAKQRRDEAQAAADKARAELGQRAVDAYTGMGSQMDVLLGAQNFSDFSDRLEFMGALAQSDADLATQADTAAQQADWARQQFTSASADAAAKLAAVNQQRQKAQDLLEQASATLAKTTEAYKAYQAQLAAAQAQATQDNGGTTSSGGTTDGGGTTTYNPPPPDVSGASRAIDAAKQVVGTQYVFGSADPSVGFDCSGLTMWAWGQAGVSLPHSSAMQYAVLPHVAVSDIQPGDLLFFYSPISHVALYIGGGMMIHARHPGPGGAVQVNSVAGYGTPVVGAARP
jgi:cell wall-associated NlpC family hydrolase